MANRLTQLLGERSLVREQNLERGRIFSWVEGNEYDTRFCCGVCWSPPGVGCMVLEMWGASGSGARQCCCSWGTPGNPGAYVKKCICVCPGNIITGRLGKSCGNSGSRDFRGCSEASCLCWQGCAPYALGNRPMSGDNGCGRTGCDAFGPMCRQAYDPTYGTCCESGATAGCLCAGGGRGGVSYCKSSRDLHGCWSKLGYCLMPLGPTNGCVFVCVTCRNEHKACAYGGDVNCKGHFSCISYFSCHGREVCNFQYHVATSPGIFSDEGSTFSYQGQGDHRDGGHSGFPIIGQSSGLDHLSRQPGGTLYRECWGHSRACGCYETQGCIPVFPYGVPGSPAQPCPNVRDHGGRGGQGALRIRYIGTNSYCAYS